MYTWNPQDYAKHSSTQEIWARELLAKSTYGPMTSCSTLVAATVAPQPVLRGASLTDGLSA
jgi:hypothetical protein